jgi:hypothetical protein
VEPRGGGDLDVSGGDWDVCVWGIFCTRGWGLNYGPYSKQSRDLGGSYDITKPKKKKKKHEKNKKANRERRFFGASFPNDDGMGGRGGSPMYILWVLRGLGQSHLILRWRCTRYSTVLVRGGARSVVRPLSACIRPAWLG